MKRRVRKKKHLGEFNMKGFGVICSYKRRLTLKEVDDFLDKTILFAEANNLMVCGGFGPDESEFDVGRILPGRLGKGRPRRSQVDCTDVDRGVMVGFLETFPFIKRVTADRLKGLWW